MELPPPPPPMNSNFKPQKIATTKVEEEKFWKDIYQFHCACQEGNLENFNIYFKQESLDEKDDDKLTPLHYASWYGHLNIVELLINKKAKLDETNDKKSTALHYAAGNGRLEVVKLLVKSGALITIDAEKETPKELALRLKPENYQEIVELLKI
eukprot:TRINITY_DN14252_c0_g1_i1.p1 TRINITY_DN14252_c0_g1~~TRINITY_DN14252_c0_g1_i1.p1  ORF type:complete len:154 (+),score=45.32 TRINITY_DN14252_c0_g1_i1:47-508(+)